MGASKWFFSASGLIMLIGAFAIAGNGLNFGIDFEGGTRITAPLEQAATVDQVRDVVRRRRPRRRRGPDDRQPRARQEPRPDLLGRERRRRRLRQQRAREGVRLRRRAERGVDRPDLRPERRALGADRDHRLADRHLGLHRPALRVEGRGAGADRAAARHPDHGRRLRPHRPGGDDVDGRGAAHHPGLLALRHDHRVRPRAREHPAHAERGLLADRQPLDVRGRGALAGDQLLHAAAGALPCTSSAARRCRTSPSR